MPIIKRTTLPEPPKKRTPKEEQYRLPGRPLEAILKELHAAESAADWDGDHDEADRIRTEAHSIKERIENGELYEVDH